MEQKNRGLQGKLDEAVEKTKEIFQQKEKQDIKQRMQCQKHGGKIQIAESKVGLNSAQKSRPSSRERGTARKTERRKTYSPGLF